jgi:hypothetical protein
VSQRIKALEQRVGQAPVVREKPCTATTAGVTLLRLTAQAALLEVQALAQVVHQLAPMHVGCPQVADISGSAEDVGGRRQQSIRHVRASSQSEVICVPSTSAAREEARPLADERPDNVVTQAD